MNRPLSRIAVAATLVATLSACSSNPKVEPIEPVAARATPAGSTLLELTPSSRGPVLTLEDVLFDFEEATLRSEAYSAIRQTANYLRENPDRRAVIEGHTDHVGDTGYNVWLSNLRAESVRDALVSAGIDAARIDTGGLGEARPVASNDTPAGRQANRRVEIVFAEIGRRL